MNNYSGSQGGASQQTPGSASKVSVTVAYLSCNHTDRADIKNRASNTLRPVTIKQILEAVQPHPDAEFKLDDVELSHVDHPILLIPHYLGLI